MPVELIKKSALLVVVGILSVPIYAQAQSWGSASRSPQLPYPYGMGLTMYNQIQPYRIDSLDFQFVGLDPQQINDFEVDNETTTYHLKLDYWVLPFLNVYVLGGQVEGTTTVSLENLDFGLPTPLSNLKIDYNGWVYGAGATLAGGWGKYFVTITYDYNETDLSASNSTVKAEVITPRIGYQAGGTAFYFGGMRQEAEERHEGVIDVSYLGSVPYTVALREKETLNYLVGITSGFGEHWMLTLEGFFGDREAVLVMLDYRWGR
jgi:hypothetical protein